MTDCYVITAGPSSGKTSTMRALSALGYYTLPEAARMVIDQKISEGIPEGDVRSECDFQHEVIEMDKQIESHIPKDETCFLDRSLADNIAYMNYYRGSAPYYLIEECEDKYDGVFVLEQIPFEDDYARDENADEAEALQKEILKTYNNLGYDVKFVPLMEVDKRADFIRKHI